MPRGGARRGKGGVAYANRTDLNAGPRIPAGPSTQPVRVATGQAYGAAGQQRAAQQAIPLPQAPASGAPMPQGSGVMPGDLGPITAPSTRPGEPLTHGLPTGPGGGPEVLAPPDPLVKAAAVLNGLGNSADPASKALRDKVNAVLGNAGAA